VKIQNQIQKAKKREEEMRMAEIVEIMIREMEAIVVQEMEEETAESEEANI
jgi:hypothetical protein